MKSKFLAECLADQTGSHLIPLLWFAGESVESLRREIQAVADSGCREFIFENRGDTRFCKEPWMQILEVALQEAEKRGMRVWLMDDSHVSTGSCNDSLNRPENAPFRAQNLRIVAADVAGQVAGDAVMLPNRTSREKILCVAAYRRDDATGVPGGEAVDLTDQMHDGLCNLALPEGMWRIYFIMLADPGRTGLFARYLTMMSCDSCRHLIDEVHEKIYARFAKYFGNTFAGFFSDEPSWGNCNGEYSGGVYNTRTGQMTELWPYWDDLPEKLAARCGCTVSEVLLKLPALWDEVTDLSAAIRLNFMDEITCRWRDNFTRQLSEWCAAHGVEYIGHYLEDMAAHMRTGWGCGHYFRTMQFQDMAGVDLVMAQMIPGVTNVPHARNNGLPALASQFYWYTLPKLASSLAHLTPHMHNRSICECFGAMGWSEGLPVMRTVANLMISGGVNNFIPHAFSMAIPDVFPSEKDNYTNDAKAFLPPGYTPGVLPPSFYCGGFNPQFKIFGQLVQYMQRICHLLAHGQSLAQTAVYYPAEADWFNLGAARNLDEVTAMLTRNGVDFDLVYADILSEHASMKSGKLQINDRIYAQLIVPGSAVFPEAVLRQLAQYAQQGLVVIFTDTLPERTENPATVTAELTSNLTAVALNQLPEKLTGQFPLVAHRFSELRTYAQKQDDGAEMYLFYNSGYQSHELTLQTAENLLLYDPWDNRAWRVTPQGNQVALQLDAQGLLIVFCHCSVDSGLAEYVNPAALKRTVLALRYCISARSVLDKNGEFQVLLTDSPAVDLLPFEGMSRFCGEFRYETEFEWPDSAAHILEIPGVGDCAEVWLNGIYCGAELGPVARFAIASAIKCGKNHLVIQTADSPCYLDRATASDKVGWGAALRLRRHGFIGEIKIG